MLDFRKIELSDKERIDAYLQHQNYRASDYSFANLYCWSNRFDTQFATTDEWLFIRFKDNNGRNSYLKPIGNGDLAQAIQLIQDDHRLVAQTPFQLRGLTHDMIAEIEAAMPNTFDYKLNRSVSDYIYTSEKLINLKGKKLQSKRNHINRFKRENDWVYQSLHNNPQLVRQCYDMLEEWMRINMEEKDASLVYEDDATTLMLKHFEALQLRGGAVFANGELVAFTLGERLTADTFVVHVEKAFTDTHGAYTIINQQFVENELSAFTYINREEDMGLDNLRQAKLSYQPDILLEKHVARLKNQS